MNRYKLRPQAYPFRFTFRTTPQAEALCTGAVIAANLPTFLGIPNGFERSVEPNDKLILWYNHKTGRAFWFGEGSEGSVRNWFVTAEGVATPVYVTTREWKTSVLVLDKVKIPGWPALEVLLPSQFGGLLAAAVDPSYAREIKKDMTIPNSIGLAHLARTEVVWGTTQEALVARKDLRVWLEA